MKADTRFDGGPTTLPWETIKHLEEAIFLEDADDRPGGVDSNRSKLTHQEKTKNVIEIGAREYHPGYGSVAQVILGIWMKVWGCRSADREGLEMR